MIRRGSPTPSTVWARRSRCRAIRFVACSTSRRRSRSRRRLSNQVLLAIILYYHGRAAQDRGEFAQARASFERATAIGRAAGNRPTIAHPLSMEGRLALAEGRIEDAAPRWARASRSTARTTTAGAWSRPSRRWPGWRQRGSSTARPRSLLGAPTALRAADAHTAVSIRAGRVRSRWPRCGPDGAAAPGRRPPGRKGTVSSEPARSSWRSRSRGGRSRSAGPVDGIVPAVSGRRPRRRTSWSGPWVRSASCGRGSRSRRAHGGRRGRASSW